MLNLVTKRVQPKIENIYFQKNCFRKKDKTLLNNNDRIRKPFMKFYEFICPSLTFKIKFVVYIQLLLLIRSRSKIHNNNLCKVLEGHLNLI